MARIRTIKPEFFTSEDIVSLSPLARILYIALWCEADKEGRMVWKPATFKLRYMPGDECDIQALCTEILNRDLVRLYGDGFAFIPSFAAHQHINPRESASQLPEPTSAPRVGTRQARVATGANLDVHAQVGREGKGREGNDEDASAFEEFWKTYPKKSAKPAALRAFKAAKAKTELTALLAHVMAMRDSDDWVKEGGKYIPHPATYLNQRRWEDEAPGAEPERSWV